MIKKHLNIISTVKLAVKLTLAIWSFSHRDDNELIMMIDILKYMDKIEKANCMHIHMYMQTHMYISACT